MSNHLIHRASTQRWQHNWLDFVVTEENGKRVGDRRFRLHPADSAGSLAQVRISGWRWLRPAR